MHILIIGLFAYAIISAIIVHYWLAWDYRLAIPGSIIGLPIAIIVWFLTKILHLKLSVGGIKIEF
jgi:Ca2+/H+ antiporter